RMTANRPSFVDDRDGAMLVIAIPMAVLLTALLYHMVGVGNAVVLSQDMRRAADLAAYDCAVRHARGMNVVAVMNVLMMGVESVFATWRLLHTALLPLVIAGCPPQGVGNCAGDATSTATALTARMASAEPNVEEW